MLGRQPRDKDAGSVAVFTAVFALAIIALVALLVDGGGELNARERAADIAEQAARAAAEDLSPASVRAGPVAIDWTDTQANGGPCSFAQQAVTAYSKDFNSVTSARVTGCGPGANPRSVTVSVEVTTSPVIPVPGFTTVTMTATQSATVTCGNADQQEAC